MIKLKKFKIIGFQSRNRMIEIVLSGEQSSVIYGENGCGKTTFLKLIHSILNVDNSALIDEGVREVEIIYENHELEENIIRIHEIQRLDEETGAVDIEYDWSEFLSSELADSTSLSLGVERGVSNQATRVEASDIFRFVTHPRYRGLFSRVDIHEFSEKLATHIRKTQVTRTRNRRDELSIDKRHSFLQSIKISNIESLLIERYRFARSLATERIQNALFDTLAIAINPDDRAEFTNDEEIPENFVELVIENKERLIEALDDNFENNFKDQVIHRLREITRKSDVKRIRENNLLSKLILNMMSELDVEKQLLSSINTLVDTFNKYLIGNKKLVVNTKDTFIEIEGEPHPVSVLSSGERHILTFLSLVVIAGNDRDFLIIDEPEISLNIKWQRTLMALLQDLAPFTQIIVASHSPIIAKKNPHSLVSLEPQEVQEDMFE